MARLDPRTKPARNPQQLDRLAQFHRRASPPIPPHPLIHIDNPPPTKGPITEEVVFRSLLTPLHLLAHVPPTRLIFLTPLYFGIAHIHHFYEYALTHPHTPLRPALARSLLQFAYTTLFGWYATFLFLRTASLPAVILAHSFCNWCGLPRLWGRVEAGVPIGPPDGRGKDDGEGVGGRASVQVAGGRLGLRWTVAYYVVLFAGVGAFYRGFWGLTESSRAMAQFGGSSK